MYQCISTFPVLAFTYGLVTHWSIFQVNIKAYKWEAPEFAHRGWGDSMLASCIKFNSKDFILLEGAFGAQAPEQCQSFHKEHKNFKLLVSTTKSCAWSKKHTLDTKDSAESFHRFLFAALIMYAVFINKLHGAFENPALETEEEQNIIQLAKGFTQILANVLCSSSFKRHLRVMMDGKFLDCLMANPRNKDAYWKFGQQYNIISTDPGSVTTPSGCNSGFDIDPAMSRTLQVWKFF